MGDLATLGLLVALTAAAGVALGMLAAPRLAARDERLARPGSAGRPRRGSGRAVAPGPDDDGGEARG